MSLEENGILTYCHTPQCKICRLSILDQDPEFFSNLSVKKYKFNGRGTCKSLKCIYLISCKHNGCQMKYVGFTTTPLNKRMSGHRANMVNGTEGIIMFKHFTKVHAVTDMIIKPLEFCDGKFLRAKEKFWMQELNTIFPYGLNNRIDISGIRDAYQHAKSTSNRPIYSVFNIVKNNRTKRGSGNRATDGNVVNPFNPTEFISSIDNSNTSFIAKKCRQEVMVLKLKVIYKLLLYISKELSNVIVIYKSNEHLLHLLRDLCLYRLWQSNPKAQTKHHNFIMVKYVNRLLDQVKIGKIIHSTQSLNIFPGGKECLSKTGITYKYSNTIRSKVTNYKDTVTKDHSQVQCACNNYREFIDNHHGHVITGNLNIIENVEVKNILVKGLNYREKQPLNVQKAYASIQSALDCYIDTVSNTENIPIKMFSPWKAMVLRKVKSLLNNAYKYPVTTVLDKKVNKDYLEALHAQFVVVPVDKASNNIGIICKRFYLDVLFKEITESGNFVPSNVNRVDINREYSTILKQLGDQQVYKDNLPFVYWIPKFHKAPIGFRYITSGKNTCVNGLSKILSICLKSLLEVTKKHSYNMHKFDHIRDYIITDSNKDIINYMMASNLTASFKDVKTYDFQTLYTNIPQDKLKDNLGQFIKDAFQIKNRTYICNRYKDAVFSDTRAKKYSFTADELINYLNYSIDHAFISFMDQVRRQGIGIPMGRNDGSHLANIFLHMYEKSFYHNLIENHQNDTISKLGDMFRYQDDLITFGMQTQSNIGIHSIYPREMIIKNTNLSHNQVTYLDLEITVKDNRYEFKSFDKRKDFDFPIVKYPNLQGNIPINPAYGVFISQVTRFCSINGRLDNLKKDVIELARIMLRQGYKYNMLKIKFRQFARDNIVKWAHFGINFLEMDFINSIIPKIY